MWPPTPSWNGNVGLRNTHTKTLLGYTIMASQWFYQLMGEQIGPVSSTELRNLAQRGMISTETQIANAPNGPWVPAARVKGLFAAPNGMPPSTPVTQPPPVPCHNDVAQDEPSGLSKGAFQLLQISAGDLGNLGRRTNGHPDRPWRYLLSRSSSLRAAARTWRMASAPVGLFQNISVPFTR